MAETVGRKESIKLNCDDEIISDETFETMLDALDGNSDNGQVAELLQVMNENRIISREEAEQILEVGGPNTVVKCGLPPHVRPSDPENTTDPEECVSRLLKNDPALVEINLNNMKRTPIPLIQRMIMALKENTHLKRLMLANTALTDTGAEPFLEALEYNTTLEVLNIETNFLSGDFLARLFKAALINQTVREIKAVNQSPTFSTESEMEIMHAVNQNRGLTKVSVNLRHPEAKNKVEQACLRNGEIRRQQRRLQQMKEAETNAQPQANNVASNNVEPKTPTKAAAKAATTPTPKGEEKKPAPVKKDLAKKPAEKAATPATAAKKEQNAVDVTKTAEKKPEKKPEPDKPKPVEKDKPILKKEPAKKEEKPTVPAAPPLALATPAAPKAEEPKALKPAEQEKVVKNDLKKVEKPKEEKPKENKPKEIKPVVPVVSPAPKLAEAEPKLPQPPEKMIPSWRRNIVKKEEKPVTVPVTPPPETPVVKVQPESKAPKSAEKQKPLLEKDLPKKNDMPKVEKAAPVAQAAAKAEPEPKAAPAASTAPKPTLAMAAKEAAAKAASRGFGTTEASNAMPKKKISIGEKSKPIEDIKPIDTSTPLERKTSIERKSSINRPGSLNVAKDVPTSKGLGAATFGSTAPKPITTPSKNEPPKGRRGSGTLNKPPTPSTTTPKSETPGKTWGTTGKSTGTSAVASKIGDAKSKFETGGTDAKKTVTYGYGGSMKKK